MYRHYIDKILTNLFSIKPQITGITLSANPSAIVVLSGKSQISITKIPSVATISGITYLLSDTSLAAIDMAGLLTAKKDGIVSVTGMVSGTSITATIVVSISGQFDGIVDSKIESKINIHPNPASEFIRISSDLIIQNVLVINNQGVQVLNYSINPSLININGLPNGLYQVLILTNQGYAVKRFIKE